METELGLDEIVRIGKGKKLYRITGIDARNDGTRYAVLEPVEGYTTASADLDRLKRATP